MIFISLVSNALNLYFKAAILPITTKEFPALVKRPAQS